MLSFPDSCCRPPSFPSLHSGSCQASHGPSTLLDPLSSHHWHTLPWPLVRDPQKPSLSLGHLAKPCMCRPSPAYQEALLPLSHPTPSHPRLADSPLGSGSHCELCAAWLGPGFSPEPRSRRKQQEVEGRPRCKWSCPCPPRHNDLPWQLLKQFNNRLLDAKANLTVLADTHTNIPKLKAGFVGGQV